MLARNSGTELDPPVMKICPTGGVIKAGRPQQVLDRADDAPDRRPDGEVEGGALDRNQRRFAERRHVDRRAGRAVRAIFARSTASASECPRRSSISLMKRSMRSRRSAS